MEGLGSGEKVLTAAFVAYESAFSYSQFLPSIMTIRTFVDSADKVAAIRHGEIIGTTFTTGFALLFSWIMHSWLPLIMAALACSFVLVVYEWALRQAPGWDSGD